MSKKKCTKCGSMPETMAFKLCIALSLVAQFGATVHAGKFNPTVKIGDPAPAWKNLPAVDGKTYSLEDFNESDVLVIFFTCNSCPYVVDYEDRIIALAKEYQEQPKKVQLIGINVNLVDEDSLPAMKVRAKTKGFQFPYLFDESQQTARDLGATFTPEFFVLNKTRKIVYMGAFDDSTDAKKVSQHHVKAAIEATQTGKKIEIPETIAIGCGVRYKRTRRKRKKTSAAK